MTPNAPLPAKYSGFSIPEDAVEETAAFIERKGLTPREYIVMHPFPAHASYRWPLERWRELIRELSNDRRIVVTGGPGNVAETQTLATDTDAVSAAGELDILSSMALIKDAAAVVSVDTAAVHIASTVGTPVIALYGPGDPVLWGPLGVPHKILFHNEPCSICKKAECFQDKRYCMEQIEVGEVLDALGGIAR